jgi:hypothetical protein
VFLLSSSHTPPYDGANKQWTAAIHEWKRGWNDGSANWLLLDSNSLAIPPDMMIDE